MALIRYQPARELTSFQREFDRLFGSFFDTPTGNGGPRTTRSWAPAIDLIEGEHGYALLADLPGLTSEDVNIELQDGVLTISGERTTSTETEGKGFRRIERASGSFVRKLTLPEGVDGEAISATFDNGVLEISIPKPAERQPQKITIAAASQPALGQTTAAA
jgi:HSP20 family protein